METVFVADDNHAQLRLVRTGKRTDDEVELLAGVSPGEQVIVEARVVARRPTHQGPAMKRPSRSRAASPAPSRKRSSIPS